MGRIRKRDLKTAVDIAVTQERVSGHEKALALQEIQYRSDKAAANEWRAAMNDQRATLVSYDVWSSQHKSIEESQQALERSIRSTIEIMKADMTERFERSEKAGAMQTERTAQSSDTWSRTAVIIAMIASLASTLGISLHILLGK